MWYMKSLFILDDHSMLRNGIVSFFMNNSDWKITGQAGSKEEFLEILPKLSENNELPDILICDINLNKENSGLDIMKYVKDNYPSIKIVAYSMFESISYINKAIASGAAGYVSKSKDEKELLKCLESVYNGNTYFSHENLDSLIVYTNVLQALTKREKTVFDLLIAKKSNTEIANIMNISKRTVDNYISCIYDKTACCDRNKLIQKFGEK